MSKKKIEKIDLPSFELVGFDPIDSFAYKVEYQLTAIQDKLNEIIEKVNSMEEK